MNDRIGTGADKSPVLGVALDFGRVLVNFDHMRACEALARHIDLPREAVYAKLFGPGRFNKGHDDGSVGSEEFFEMVAHELELPPSILFDHFSEMWSNIFWSNDGAEGLLAKFPLGMPKVIVSNTDPIHWAAAKERNVIATYFPDPASHVLSFKVGACKPDERIFQEALRHLRLPAENVLYVDDIQVNLDAAKKLGFRTAQYDSSEDSISKLEKIFTTHGVIKKEK